ncbi:hypothetical protein Hanom_Chr14g01329731 [Helianthus anomalus]
MSELRWSIIRRIYSIVAIQLLLTIAVGAIIASYDPTVSFLTRGGFAGFLLLFVAPFISMCLLASFCVHLVYI